MAHHVVVVLDEGQELLETFVVVGAHGLVDLVGDAVGGVDGVEADAALVAGAGLLGDRAEHLHLLEEVVGGLVDMGEAVDLVAGEVGGGRHKVSRLRVVGQGVGHGGGVDMAADHGMIDDLIALQQLAHDVDADFPLPQAVLVLLRSFHISRPRFSI